MMKKALAALLAALMLVPLLALAEEDHEITIEDTAGIFFEEIIYDDVTWNFPIDLCEMDPELVRLANKHMFLPADYVPDDLVQVDVPSSRTIYLRYEAAQALEEMFAAARQDGVNLVLISGYRSYEDETELYNYYVGLYGKDHADIIDDMPGASEHQLGLAVDLGTSDGTCRLDECFDTTGESAWLAANAARYGWILRYPQNKQDVTGVIYSPWNYRYVGKDEAEKITASGLTMEEYFGE